MPTVDASTIPTQKACLAHMTREQWTEAGLKTTCSETRILYRCDRCLIVFPSGRRRSSERVCVLCREGAPASKREYAEQYLRRVH